MRRQVIVLIVVAFVVVACGAGVGSSPGGANPSARQVLERAAENYRKVTGYEAAGNVTTLMRIDDRTQNFENTLAIAYGGPGRTRFEADSPQDTALLVTAGDSIWTYRSSLGKYTVRPVAVEAVPRAGLPGLDPEAAHPFAGYARLADHVAEAKLVGRDTVTVDGRAVPTYELAVTYDSTVVPPASSGATQVPKRLSIDAERFLVLGEETTLEQPHPALPKPIHIEQRTRYTHLAWNVRPPDSRFVFQAPASAARAENLANEPAEETSALVGKPAPDFALADLQGTRRALADHRGKVVLLDFWATWCGPCRREMPIIQQLHERYAKKGLVVYGVNCSEPAARAKSFMTKYQYRFPTLLDRNGEVQGSFQVTAIPTVFIVDRKGFVRAHLIGGRSESELVAALENAGLDTGP